jgi:hypothetical protein
MTNTTRIRVAALLAALFMITSPMAGVAGASVTSSTHEEPVGPAQVTDSTAEDVIYRVNAGGETYTASDGPDWSGDYDQYVSGSSSPYSTADSVSLDGSVPSGTPL